MKCTLCPRACQADRSVTCGYCGQTDAIRIAKVMIHRFEEPCISSKRGSGAIFFSGCPLRCVYCQNQEISRGKVGKITSVEELAQTMLDLQAQNVANINLVTPTHYADQIIEAIKKIKGQLKIPVVYNTSGYETEKTVIALRDTVDVYLTDFKYFSPELAKKYSSAPDYYDVAKRALAQMIINQPRLVFAGDEIQKGVILRHLVLPNCKNDSIALLNDLSKEFGTSSFLLSLMAQYTPDFCPEEYPELKRKITSYEYKKVLDVASCLGFDGYCQERDSAGKKYTPDFGGLQNEIKNS